MSLPKKASERTGLAAEAAKEVLLLRTPLPLLLVCRGGWQEDGDLLNRCCCLAGATKLRGATGAKGWQSHTLQAITITHNAAAETLMKGGSDEHDACE
jgi:hypothetical protein